MHRSVQPKILSAKFQSRRNKQVTTNQQSNIALKKNRNLSHFLQTKNPKLTKQNPLNREIVRERDLISINKVFPLAFTLFRASPVSSFSHLRAYNFPQRLISLGSSEVPFEFSTDPYELSRLLMAPLRLSWTPVIPHRRRRRRRYLTGDHRWCRRRRRIEQGRRRHDA